MRKIKTINNFKEIRDEGLIGKPMTPSKWTSEITYTPISRLRMTCGGGMGGAQWFEYIERIPLESLKANDLIKVKDIDGHEKILNTSYIVSVENDITVISADLDSQNNNFDIGLYEYRWLIYDGTKVELSDRF